VSLILTAIVIAGYFVFMLRVSRKAGRGLVMVFFMVSLGLVTMQFAAPGRSFIGRHAGGLFIYAIAVMDAYVAARYAWERHRARIRASQAEVS
jgi:hypothetical protein